jgi:hypothetical protein
VTFNDSAFTGFGYGASANVQDAIDTIALDLASSSKGTLLLAHHSVAGTPESWAGGVLQTLIDNMIGWINARARKNSVEEIDANWGFTGRPAMPAASIGGGDQVHAEDVLALNLYDTANAMEGWAQLGSEQCVYSFGNVQLTDPCSIRSPDQPGMYLVVVAETGGTDFHLFNPMKLSHVTRTMTGHAAGLTEISAICSDGSDHIYALLRRAAGNDSIVKIAIADGVVAWEQNLSNANALSGYPLDRVIAGRRLSASNIDLLIGCGNLDLATSGVFESRRTDTGALNWASSEASLTGKNFAGGIAHDGSSVYFTTDVGDGTTASLVRKVLATGGTAGTPIAMASSGSSSVDIGSDLVFDGRRFVWVSASGYFRYYDPGVAGWHTSETVVSGTAALGNPARCLCFDGFNLWAPSFDTINFQMDLHRFRTAIGDFTVSPEKYCRVFYDTIATWSPASSPWSLGRMSKVGSHAVLLHAEPGNLSYRNSLMVILNSTLW